MLVIYFHKVNLTTGDGMATDWGLGEGGMNGSSNGEGSKDWLTRDAEVLTAVWIADPGCRLVLGYKREEVKHWFRDKQLESLESVQWIIWWWVEVLEHEPWSGDEQ